MAKKKASSKSTEAKSTETKAAPKKKTRGNLPKGELIKSRCPKCGSTNRAPYTTTRSHRLSNRKVVWRWTHCLDCGQHRVDRSEESL